MSSSQFVCIRRDWLCWCQWSWFEMIADNKITNNELNCVTTRCIGETTFNNNKLLINTLRQPVAKFLCPTIKLLQTVERLRKIHRLCCWSFFFLPFIRIIHTSSVNTSKLFHSRATSTVSIKLKAKRKDGQKCSNVRIDDNETLLQLNSIGAFARSKLLWSLNVLVNKFSIARRYYVHFQAISSFKTRRH